MITLTPNSDHITAATDPARRVSSHRTSQGHLVYYRCYCGQLKSLTMRWTTDGGSGSRRLGAQWVPTCATCDAC